MKKWMRATTLVWLMACTGDTEGPNPPAGENAVQEGSCDVPTDSWDVLEAVQTLAVRGDAWPLEAVQTRVLTTEAEEQMFETETGLVFDPVDYEENTVLFATAGASSTCGFLGPDWQVRTTNGAAHLEFSATDTTGDCMEVCDMEWRELLAVVIPHERVPPSSTFTACATLFNECN